MLIIIDYMLTFLFVLGLVVYFIPSLIGSGKNNSGSILALNILLGWTFVGWVVALVWALSKDTVPAVVESKPLISEELIKLSQLKSDGVISEDEFNIAKSKILNS